jgi:subtilisin family serine protease
MAAARLRSRALPVLFAALVAVAVGGPARADAARDPLLAEQWAFSEPGMTGAQEAWTQSTGAGVVVAVLDSGVQLDHPDLSGAIWTNPDEIAGNGRDDDRNGIVDDVHGADMFDFSGTVADDEGHGTHVAGIIAARHANGIGGSGMAPAAQIMPVKVLDASRSGNNTVLAAGIRYAVDEGAKIINASINGDTSTSTLQDAVRYAQDHGVTLVASAGNNGRNLDVLPSFPASYSDPALLSVTATDQVGGLWSLANRGLRSVDLAAPGELILSTGRGSRYETRSGTSMAAPMVAGALALLASARPDLPQDQLRDAILATTTRAKDLSGLLATGRLDVGAAMHRVLPGDAWRTTVTASTAGRLRLRAASTRAGRRATVRWTAPGVDPVARWRVSLDGRVVATVRGSRPRVARRLVRRAGRHQWRVVGFDAGGAKVVAAKRSFRVLAPR